MNHEKVTINQEYLNILETLKAEKNVKPAKYIQKYEEVKSKVEGLEFVGDARERVIGNVGTIDAKCDDFYNIVSCYVKKAALASEVLYPDLVLYKKMVDEQHASVDLLAKYNQQLADAMAAERAQAAQAAQTAGEDGNPEQPDAGGNNV